MLQRVMPRPEKDVKAEHALQQRRRRERNMPFCSLRKDDADHLFLSSEEQLPRQPTIATIEVMRRILLISSLVAAAAFPAGIGAASSTQVLVGKVGLHDSYRISLTLTNGN